MTPAELARRLRWRTNAVTAQLSRLQGARLVEPTGRPDRRSRYWEVVDRMFRLWILMREDRSARRTLRFLADFLQSWFDGARREVGFFEADEEPQATARAVRDAPDRARALAALHPEVREVVTLLLDADPRFPRGATAGG